MNQRIKKKRIKQRMKLDGTPIVKSQHFSLYSREYRLGRKFRWMKEIERIKRSLHGVITRIDITSVLHSYE